MILQGLVYAIGGCDLFRAQADSYVVLTIWKLYCMLHVFPSCRNGSCESVALLMVSCSLVRALPMWNLSPMMDSNRRIGTAVGGLILPLIMPVLVNSVGPSKTLRILSLAFIVLILPGLPFLRPRLPEISVRARQSRSNAENGRNLLRSLNVPFLLYVLANLLQGFAYFLPLLWLPSKQISRDLRSSIQNEYLIL